MVGENLGLDKLPDGDLLMDLVWNADRLRQGRIPFLRLLKLLASGWRRSRGFVWQVRGIVRGKTPPTMPALIPGRTPDEPEWDGSLR